VRESDPSEGRPQNGDQPRGPAWRRYGQQTKAFSEPPGWPIVTAPSHHIVCSVEDPAPFAPGKFGRSAIRWTHFSTHRPACSPEKSGCSRAGRVVRWPSLRNPKNSGAHPSAALSRKRGKAIRLSVGIASGNRQSCQRVPAPRVPLDRKLDPAARQNPSVTRLSSPLRRRSLPTHLPSTTYVSPLVCRYFLAFRYTGSIDTEKGDRGRPALPESERP